jgi:hypothetical protein
MPGRHLVAVSAAAAAVVAFASALPAQAGSQGYAYDCPPLADPATVTLTATAPASVQPNGAFSITDGVISGTIELGQFAGFVNDGDQATITAPIVFGTADDANVDASVSATVTLTKSGTAATFSQPLPPIAFTAGPDVASGVGFAPGNAVVGAAGQNINCTRIGTEGPFTTTEIAGEALPPPSVTSTTAPPATTATTAARASTGVTAAPLADSGAEAAPLLILGAGATGVALAAARLRRRARPGPG